MNSIDAVVDNMYGKMCPNCYGTIFPGEFHSCPAQSINEIAKERDAIQAKLDVAVEALKKIANCEEPQTQLDYAIACDALETIGGMNERRIHSNK